MIALDRLLRHFLLDVPKQTGSFDPNKNLPYFEHELTFHESYEIRAFFTWLTKHKLTYGTETLDRRWKEFQQSKGGKEKDALSS